MVDIVKAVVVCHFDCDCNCESYGRDGDMAKGGEVGVKERGERCGEWMS